MRDPYPTLVIGHRGACADAPENTLASIRRAAQDGARMVEVDVKLTRDGQPIIFHDSTLERTTDGRGLVASTTLETLRTLDAGSWFSPRFAGEAVPTLEQTLKAVDALALNLEIKPCLGREEETARRALAVARAHWSPDKRPPVISSFSRACLAVARDMVPQWPRALLGYTVPDDWLEAARTLRLSAFNLSDKNISPQIIRQVTSAGFAVAVWTVNDIERALFLKARGISAVFTDHPGALLAAV